MIPSARRYLHQGEDGLPPEDRTQSWERPLPQAPLLGASVRDPAKFQARLDAADAAIERECAKERDCRWIDSAATVAFVAFFVLVAATIIAQVAR